MPAERTPLKAARAAGRHQNHHPVNERQQAHIDYFLERLDHWLSLKREYWAARMLAARDADQKYPLRSEEEGAPVFDHLRHLDEERRPAAVK